MDLEAEIREAGTDSLKLEQLYQFVRQEGLSDEFQSALAACYEEFPDNLLYAAWDYRFQNTTDESVVPRRSVNESHRPEETGLG